MSMVEDIYRDEALRMFVNDHNIEVDVDAKVKVTEDGAWVQAWVWIYNDED